MKEIFIIMMCFHGPQASDRSMCFDAHKSQIVFDTADRCKHYIEDHRSHYNPKAETFCAR